MSQGNLSQKRIDAAIRKSLSQTKYRRGESLIGKRQMPAKQAFRKRPGSTEGVVGGVLVAGPQGPERKKWDVSVGSTLVANASPYILSLTNGIAQGTNVGNRVGDRIKCKALDLEMNVTAQGTTTGFVDVMLVWDKQPNNTIASVSDVLTFTNTNLTFGNISNLERFQVLRREQINFDQASKLSECVKWHMPLDMATRFPSAAGWPITNDLLVVAVSGGAAGTNGANIAYIARLTFTDE